MNSNEILNKYINLIDKGYCSDCNELNCIDNFPHSKITHAIRELQQENKILRENAENNDKVVDKVNWENMLLKKENKQLKIQISAREEVCNRLESNWNKLKEYCKENTLCYEVGDDENTKLIGSKIHGLNVLDKMQEMEKNYGNVEDNT